MTPAVSSRAPDSIARALLAWFDRYGRHDLPWQHPRTPYRVWLAEIMLQQTQVATVIDYFNSFTGRFPDVETLAAAEIDDVMAYWAGLGYYARARNLHAAARQVVARYEGEFPSDVENLMTLPGIGRSTAGAIAAQAFGVWAPILDGNAKRVLARLAAITAAPGSAAYDHPLWQLAERYTPASRLTDYTQAIMDLGATLCTRRRPDCARCPLEAVCVARADGLQNDIPAPRKKRRRARRETTMLVITDGQGRILLEKRPPAGIWGGLWSLPEADGDNDLVAACRQRFGIDVATGPALGAIEHGLTHFLLTIHLRRMQYRATARIMETDFAWFARADRPGLPAPVARLLDSSQLELDL